MSDFFKIHNIVINAAMGNKGNIILKPTHSTKTKIKHYSLLKNIEQSQQLGKNKVLENYLDPRDSIILTIRWEYSIKEIGEYTYYYLSMKALDIKLNIVKKK